MPESKQLDRDEFCRKVTLKALRVPKQLCHRYVRLLKNSLIALPKVKAIQVDESDPDQRLMLLREGLSDIGSIETSQSLPELLEKDKITETTYTLHLDYSHLTVEDVMKQILPEGWEIPGSFETVGHIAHLNLRDEYLPYKHLIGQVVLDKNPTIKTVINKVGSIENEYRVLPLEVIAGEDRLEAVVKQHKARFKLNFAEVYWNSRLEREHQRLVEHFAPGEVVIDVMAGIGPFAIPAAQRGNEVWANDLNPRSHHYLVENIALNKVQSLVKPFQLDGREFIRRMAGSGAQHSVTATGIEGESAAANGPDIPQAGLHFDHAIMNLPASAVEFLDAFNGAFCRETWQGRQLPLVHVYTFARSDETDQDVYSRVERHLGGTLEQQAVLHLVRDVSPNKRMLCATFRVPQAVAFSGAAVAASGAERNADIPESLSKRQKTESAEHS